MARNLDATIVRIQAYRDWMHHQPFSALVAVGTRGLQPAPEYRDSLLEPPFSEPHQEPNPYALTEEEHRILRRFHVTQEWVVAELGYIRPLIQGLSHPNAGTISLLERVGNMPAFEAPGWTLEEADAARVELGEWWQGRVNALICQIGVEAIPTSTTHVRATEQELEILRGAQALQRALLLDCAKPMRMISAHQVFFAPLPPKTRGGARQKDTPIWEMDRQFDFVRSGSVRVDDPDYRYHPHVITQMPRIDRTGTGSTVLSKGTLA